MSELRRTRVGRFTLNDKDKFITLEEIMEDKESYSLDDEKLKKIIKRGHEIVDKRIVTYSINPHKM